MQEISKSENVFAVFRGGPLDGLHLPRTTPLPVAFRYRGHAYRLTFSQGFLAFYEHVGRQGQRIKWKSSEHVAMNRANYHSWLRRHNRNATGAGQRLIIEAAGPEPDMVDEQLTEELA